MSRGPRLRNWWQAEGRDFRPRAALTRTKPASSVLLEEPMRGTILRRCIASAVVAIIACLQVPSVVGQDAEPAAATQPATRPAPPPQQEIGELSRALLRTIEQQQIDIAFDGFDDVALKRAAIEAAVSAFSMQLVNSAIDQKQYDAICQDYVTYRNATSPRLSGRIVRIGRGQPLADLATASSQLKPGDLVLLGEGEFELPAASKLPPRLWSDIAIVGRSPQLTTLRVSRAGSLEFANRLRLEQMRIDCNNECVFDLRGGGACHLRTCELFNYNSGAGGSNALFINHGVCLIEGCFFEGRSGRASQTDGGDAFDFRGRCALFARQSQFIDNDEIVRPFFPCVFDGCTALSNSRLTPATYVGATLWLRDSPSLVTGSTALNSFAIASDDLVFVQRAAGHGVQIDQPSQDLIDVLAIQRRLPYWIGLLRHDKPEIRDVAAKQLSKLIGMEVSASPARDGDAGVLQEGSAALAAEVEFARLMNWLEGNRSKLRWDGVAGAYTVVAK